MKAQNGKNKGYARSGKHMDPKTSNEEKDHTMHKPQPAPKPTEGNAMGQQDMNPPSTSNHNTGSMTMQGEIASMVKAAHSEHLKRNKC